MKKILKFFFWINAVALFVLNIALQLNVIDGKSIKITVKQEQALADGCQLYYDWIEGEAYVTCSSGMWGTCLKEKMGYDIESWNYDVTFYCKWTGYITDYCNKYLIYGGNWITSLLGI
jgi:hypothetical protein